MTITEARTRSQHGEHHDDQGLLRDVRAELARSRSIDADRIGVSVQDGVCHLDGEVRSAAEDEDVRKAASRVHGIVAFIDRLRTTP